MIHSLVWSPIQDYWVGCGEPVAKPTAPRVSVSFF